jgi:hypothetical protein
VVVASLTTDDDVVLQVATTGEHKSALIGPFTATPEPRSGR